MSEATKSGLDAAIAEVKAELDKRGIKNEAPRKIKMLAAA